MALKISTKELNRDFLYGVFPDSLGSIDPIDIHLAKTITSYNHPLFPSVWTTKPIVVLYDEWLLDTTSPILSTLMKLGVKIVLGYIDPDTNKVEPYEYLSINGFIPPLGKPIDLEELFKSRAVGKRLIWEPTAYIHDVLDNLYQLWVKLDTVENRTKFLFKILQGVNTKRNRYNVVLSSNGTINITGLNLIKFPNNTLKVKLLEDGSGLLEGSSTRSTNAKVWLGKSYNPNHKSEVDGGFILTLHLMRLMKYFTSEQIEGMSRNLTSLWKAEENYGVKPKPDSTDAAILNNVIKPIGIQLVSANISYPGIGFSTIGSNSPTGDPSSSDLIEYIIGEGGIVAPHKYVSYDEYCITHEGAEAMGVGLRVNPQYLEEHPEATVYNTPIEYLEVLSNNIDPKSLEGAKLFNRPTGNNKAVTAEGTEAHPLVASHLLIGTKKGKKKLYGIETPIVITNSRLGHGSGVASYNLDKEPLSFRIDKKLKGQLSSYLIPPTEKEKLRNLLQGTGNSVLSKLAPLVKRKLEKIVEEGKVFGPNQSVMSIWDSYPEYKTSILETPDVNLHFKLKPLDEDSVKVNENTDGIGSILLSVTTESIIENDYQVKLRAPGIKCTTHPEHIKFQDGRDWTLFLPYEALKGRLMQMYIFANAIYAEQGIETTYISSVGKLVFDTPITYKGDIYEEVDLTPEAGDDTLLNQWVKDNTELVWTERYVSKHIIQRLYKEEPNLLQLLGEDKPDADIQVLEEVQGGYLVRELIQALSGVAHVRVEITSPREYLTKQGLTLEQLTVIEAISPELAKALNESAKANHEAVKMLIAFSEDRLIACNSPNSKGMRLVTQLDNSVPELTLAQLKELLSQYLNQEEISLSKSSDILYVCDELFPSGVTLIDKANIKTYIPFSLLIKYGSISNAGTVTTGIAENVIHIVRSLIHETLTPEMERRYVNDCAVIRDELSRWGKTMQGLYKGSSKVLQRLGKTGNVCTGIKIKTSQLPELEHKNGLPVFIFHPECESIQRLRLKDGHFLAVGRNPMGSLAFGIAIIDRYAGDIGHVMCSPEVWSMANQGDSDGDVGSFINISQLQVSRKFNTETNRFDINYFQTSTEEMILWNQSVLMMGGDDDAFSSFVSGKSKWTSKLIDVNKALKGYTPPKIVPLVTVIPALEYIDKGRRVAEHYTYNVGNGYGIYSVLCFWCTNQTAAIRKDILKGWSDYDRTKIQHVKKLHELIHKESATNHVQRALMLACRIIYEELGLGGYTPYRAAVFDVIAAATNSAQYGYMIAVIYDNSFPYEGKKYISMQELPKYMEHYKYEEVEGRRLLAKWLLGNESADSLAIIDVLLEANSLRLTFSQVENRPEGINPNPWSSWPNAEERACVYGALRRLGKGDFSRGVNGTSTYEVVDDLIRNSKALNNFVQSDIIKYYLGNIPTMLNMFLDHTAKKGQ